LYDEIQTFADCVEYLAGDPAIVDKDPYSEKHLKDMYRPFCLEELKAYYQKEDPQKKLTSVGVLREYHVLAKNNIGMWRFLNAAYQLELILSSPYKRHLKFDEILSIKNSLAGCYNRIAHMMEGKHFKQYVHHFKVEVEPFRQSYHKVSILQQRTELLALAENAMMLNENELSHEFLYRYYQHMSVNRGLSVGGAELVPQKSLFEAERFLGQAAVALVKDNPKAIIAYSKCQQMWRKKLDKKERELGNKIKSDLIDRIDKTDPTQLVSVLGLLAPIQTLIKSKKLKQASEQLDNLCSPGLKG
jgi:hypothetical protein